MTKGLDLVKTSYSSNDVTLLMKDLSDKMEALPTEEREKLIQSGIHYSEMLPEEKEPTKEYFELYNQALERSSLEIAFGIARIAEMARHKVGIDRVPIIISLARAGIPVGILMKRYLHEKYNIDCPHYAVSIIRGKGIDVNAMNFIYNTEVENKGKLVSDIVFVDGWTGKGMIATQLNEATVKLVESDKKWSTLCSELFVLADPGNITQYCGTRRDFLLPSACLNSTVSGLISRTILNSHIHIADGDFHGAVYFKQFESIDCSNSFLNKVAEHFKSFDSVDPTPNERVGLTGMTRVKMICNHFKITDFTKVKPGIGETTRVLLRRVPWKVLIDVSVDIDKDKDIQHILRLCKEKDVPIERFDIDDKYKVCGIIKELSADA